MAHGATPRLQAIATYIFRFSPTSNRRATWRVGTASTVTKMVSASERCLLLMRRGKFTGALSRQLELIPVQTEFFRRWRICKTNKQRQQRQRQDESRSR